MERFDYIPRPEDKNYLSYLSEKVYQLGISQPQGPKLREMGYKALQPLITESLKRMYELEAVAEIPLSLRITKEDAKINALWDLSAPGNWLNPWKHDVYEHQSFTKWWDRTQIIESIRVSETIETFLGVEGPMIVYNGRTSDENDVLRLGMSDGMYLSKKLKQRIYIIDSTNDKKFNSLGQVQNFELPNRKLKSGDSIGVILRPGQGIRLLHFLNEPKNGFPKDVRVKIFPVKTGQEGLPRYPIQETAGILYYHFSSCNAAETPYSYVV